MKYVYRLDFQPNHITSSLNNPQTKSNSIETEKQDELEEVSALDMSPKKLKEAIKQKAGNIFVFAHGKSTEDMLEIKETVSNLSNPTVREDTFSPTSLGGYSNNQFNLNNVEKKLIGDQYDTSAIMSPFTPKRGKGFSFGSPMSHLTMSTCEQRGKLYNINAPPGPLGIIIDTTSEGPMIHSLKPTSQLLGLVDSGDVIVGLDGVDTRNMTAATFTRLMAKRSQGERTITMIKGLVPETPTATTPR